MHHMSKQYWLVHPNGGRQLIDPRQFDLHHLAEQAHRLGGRLVVEGDERVAAVVSPQAVLVSTIDVEFEPPITAVGPLLRNRLDRIYTCKCEFRLEINCRPTSRVLGGYYKSRSLVRVYSHDRQTGRRPMEELFDTFLHEVAHHLEYTEPSAFHAKACGRVHGRMHSRLFWRILGELKGRWADLQQR
jgi:hypothetical protein